jgi:hypothetical protein
MTSELLCIDRVREGIAAVAFVHAAELAWTQRVRTKLPET